MTSIIFECSRRQITLTEKINYPAPLLISLTIGKTFSSTEFFTMLIYTILFLSLIKFQLTFTIKC